MKVFVDEYELTDEIVAFEISLLVEDEVALEVMVVFNFHLVTVDEADEVHICVVDIYVAVMKHVKSVLNELVDNEVMDDMQYALIWDEMGVELDEVEPQVFAAPTKLIWLWQDDEDEYVLI